MTSSRYSKGLALLLVAVLVATVAVPTAAIDASKKEGPSEVAAGSENVSAVFTITEPFKNPEWEEWHLQLKTKLTNVTWTITFRDLSGEQIKQFNVDGQNVLLDNRSVSKEKGIAEITVEVEGTAPPVKNFSYPEKEQLLLAELIANRPSGATENLGSWTAYHYTTGDDDDAGSKQARKEIEQAKQAIAEAENASADASNAKSTLENAISAYESGNFPNAVNLANKAEKQADDARKQKQQSEQTSQMLLIGGGVVVLLLLIGGGVWYYRQQQDDYDKLG